MSVVLSQSHWPSLAQDLAVLSVPGSPITELSAVCNTYGVTEEEVGEILRIPYFQNLFKKAVEHFRSQGSKAGFVYRAQTLSTALSENLFNQAQSGSMEPKDAVKFLELLYKAAGFVGDKTEPTAQANVQVNLSLPYGISNPKIKHIPASQAVLDASLSG